ncbi:MAG: hypothetical protein CL938_08140 [Deltaproteobacteria bacterium]|nr:hypothetical protein [Deltaproteobacteria bacterium]
MLLLVLFERFSLRLDARFAFFSAATSRRWCGGRRTGGAHTDTGLAKLWTLYRGGLAIWPPLIRAGGSSNRIEIFR